VDTGDLLVLQQDADHVGKREVGAERELADAVAVLVGVAVSVELALEIPALASNRHEAAARNLQRHRRGGQVAVLRPE